MPAQPVFRFAPSPNGDLHLGHALSAILNHDLAKACGGRFLVRIEDIDQSRARPEFASRILDDLAWLGLEFDPEVRFQSACLPACAAALERLAALGVTYPSFLTRRDLGQRVAASPSWPRDPDGAPLFPPDERALPADEVHRRMAQGELHAIRLHMDKALQLVPDPLHWSESTDGAFMHLQTVPANAGEWGDIILARKDAPASYALAVVADDAAQGITHVVRGQDLFRATSVQRLLQQLLGLEPPLYHHHRLVLDETGAKLSKSARSSSLRLLREGGATPQDIRRMLGL